jgi:hypothetical protein
MHIEPQWVNMHLLRPHIDKKQREPKMTLRLTTLVKQVAELHDTGLRACHCTEEFAHRWIHPLGCWEKFAYECLRLADPSRKDVGGKILHSHLPLLMICYFDLIHFLCCTALS